ncbi:uncharacterized protein LOC111052422 [Nilaparvata lugens]|uniref:uncharacterized protein LOC111052422 n=1 Tax=Nilaparvata lugens TaxID=108931 RepID=UPI00193E2B76|nr:uncharacterized protein LOC111052422 [Nilaparvata lugens]
MGRRVAEFLLISALVFVSKTSATNLTESNSSSTVSATKNLTDSTSFSRVNNSSSVLPETSVSSSNQRNVSADNQTQVSNSNSTVIDRTLSPNETSSTKIDKTQTKITYQLENSATSSTNATQLPDYIDQEDLPLEEILKFKRKCCPLNKRFVELDSCFTAVCEDIPVDAPTVYRFESHKDSEIYGLRGDALLSSTPFHCDGSKPFSYPNVTVMPNGSMYFSEENEFGEIEKSPFGETDASYYCLDLEPGTVELVLYRCDVRKDSHPVAYKIMKMISAIFLTSFIVVYMMKPQLHTLHNRCLMRLMICLLGKCVLSLIFHMNFWKCGWVWVFQYATAAGAYFFYMATFCWTTVICYDIWAKIR